MRVYLDNYGNYQLEYKDHKLETNNYKWYVMRSNTPYDDVAISMVIGTRISRITDALTHQDIQVAGSICDKTILQECNNTTKCVGFKSDILSKPYSLCDADKDNLEDFITNITNKLNAAMEPYDAVLRGGMVVTHNVVSIDAGETIIVPEPVVANCVALQQLCERLRDEVVELVAENGRLRSEIATEQSAISEMIDTRRGELAELRAAHASELEKIQLSHTADMARMRQTESCNSAECQATIARLRLSMGCDDELANLQNRATVDQLTRNADDHRRQITAMRSETAAISGQLKECKAEIARLRNERDNISGRYDCDMKHASDSIAQLTKSVSELRSALKLAGDDYKGDLPATISDLHDAVAELTRALSAKDVAIAQLRDALAASEKTLATVRSLITGAPAKPPDADHSRTAAVAERKSASQPNALGFGLFD